MSYCPYCEWEISEKAKKCKHCWEWIKEEIWKEELDVSNRNLTQNLWKKTEGYQSRMASFLSDYWILLIIGVAVLFFLLKPNNQKLNVDWINQLIKLDNITTWKYELVTNSEDIIATEKWYTLFPNSLWECDIVGEKEIIKFVDAIRGAKKGEIINWTCQSKKVFTDNNTWTHVGFFFDNSYSKDLNWIIDKNWPNQRMTMLWNYLTNSKFSNGTLLDFIFMFTVKPEDNSEEPDGNLYHFWIDTSKFTMVYIKGWKKEPYYDDKRKTLIYRDVELGVSLSWGNQATKCINKSSTDFICYDAESIYEKIQDIYKQIYDKEDKHTNNMFVKTLVMNKNRFVWWNKDEIYILTNWEFKIWYEREFMYLTNLKQRYKNQWRHDAWVDKTHNLTEFTMRNTNWYQKDDKYGSFWTEAIDVLQPQLPICEWVKVNIIWLTRSTEFKPLAEKIYTQIFSPCEILFQ